MDDAMIAHSKPCITEEDVDAVRQVLCSGQIAQGELATRFETAFSERFQYAGGVATSSGTTALVLALQAIGVKGSDVLIPSYVCINVYNAVKWAGGRPVLYDIDENWNPCASSIETKLSAETRAIIVVHIFGIPSAMQEVLNLGIPVIEDCCQAIGLRIGDRFAGAYGDYGVVSFHATKLMTTGEGGMAVSIEPSSCKKLRAAKEGTVASASVGFNFPMTDIQARLGISQLHRYDAFLERRSRIAQHYLNAFSAWPEAIPSYVKQKSLFFRFPLKIKNLHFESVRQHYLLRGVQVRRGVDAILHRLTGLPDEAFPNTTKHFNETLSIPLYPSLDEKEIDSITKITKEILKRYAY